MSFHVICPSLRCRKILSLADEARGSLVSCRYCGMDFRVPQIRRRRETVPPTHVPPRQDPPRHVPPAGTLKVK
jgi:hypothetical protein